MADAVAFVDAGFLKAQGAGVLGISSSRARLKAQGCVEVFQGLAKADQLRPLRVYWYDGAFDSSDVRYQGQRGYFNAIAGCPGIQLRLGHLKETTPDWHNQLRKALIDCKVEMAEFEKHFPFKNTLEQKGVDTLIVLDLVRLAQHRAYDTAYLIAGDRDLAEAVRVAQDEGRRVVLLHPNKGGVAMELRHLADEVRQLTDEETRRMVEERSSS